MITLDHKIIRDQVDSPRVIPAMEDYIRYMHVKANQIHDTVQMRWHDGFLITVSPGEPLEKLVESIMAGWEMARIRRRGW